MQRRSGRESLTIAVLGLCVCFQIAAQEPDAASAIDAAGTFAPSGGPLGAPVRVEAGDGCIVDLEQAYDISGTLSGTLEIDYRLLVHGPCEMPPEPGKHDEEWIAHGTFRGSARGQDASATLRYTARVRAGGEVEGEIVLRGGVEGDLVVDGNLLDGSLSYSGRVR